MSQMLDCPPLEELASLAEGRVDPARRSLVLAHLDECEICFEVVSETTRFRLEETRAGENLTVDSPRVGKDTKGSVVADFSFRPEVPEITAESSGHSPRLRTAISSLAAAAVFLLVLFPLGGLRWLQGPALDPAPVAILTASLTASDPQLSQRLWTSSGPPAFSVSVNPVKRAFQSGVLLVDLEIARQQSNSLQINRIASQLDDLHAGRSWIQASRLNTPQGIRTAEVEIAKSQPFPFSFGKWAEASRLAAAAGETAFFGRATIRRFLPHAAAQELPEPVPDRLQEIGDLLATVRQPEDLARLEQAFANLIALNW